MKRDLFDEESVYILALRRLPGMGNQTLQLVVSSFPRFYDLQQVSRNRLEMLLRPSMVSTLYDAMHHSTHIWSTLYQEARASIEEHLHANILPISIVSSLYPPLLRYIPDPPMILYAQGNISLLQQTNAVAIVGTRDPTPKGEKVAHHLAKHFAEHQYCVISGLAKGIDTAAHRGALAGGGKTIAVFGTPLNQVYPASNKQLAQDILATDGLLLSELALGQRGFRSAFVQRDRIQSGLSLGVIPVQTTVDGGTMHTVKFAELQQRLIACPTPLKFEGHASQYEGIYALQHDAYEHLYTFKAGQVEQSDIFAHLQQIKSNLKSGQTESASFQKERKQQDKLARSQEIEAVCFPESQEPHQRIVPQEQDVRDHKPMAVTKQSSTPSSGQDVSQHELPELAKEVTLPLRWKGSHTRSKVGASGTSDHTPLASFSTSDAVYDISAKPRESRVAESQGVNHVAAEPDCTQYSLW